MAASLAALMAPSTRANPQASNLDSKLYVYRVLDNPSSGDEFGFRDAEQQKAQQLSSALYGSLASLLGGTAPTLNFVQSDSGLLTNDGDASANVAESPGGPKGTINVSPLATEALINDASPYHNSSVTLFPHEMAHLHQTPQTLADVMQREGGAQAFADLVAPASAAQAHIPYVAGSYDGGYSDYVQQVQQRGRQWLLATQFGNTAPAIWP